MSKSVPSPIIAYSSCLCAAKFKLCCIFKNLSYLNILVAWGETSVKEMTVSMLYMVPVESLVHTLDCSKPSLMVCSYGANMLTFTTKFREIIHTCLYSRSDQPSLSYMIMLMLLFPSPGIAIVNTSSASYISSSTTSYT